MMVVLKGSQLAWQKERGGRAVPADEQEIKQISKLLATRHFTIMQKKRKQTNKQTKIKAKNKTKKSKKGG